MDKFSTHASPNYHTFVSSSKYFICSRMGTMDNIMAFKNHSSFKYVHGSKISGQSKNKVFVFKMYVDPKGSGVDLVQRLQVGGEPMNNV